MIAKTKVEGRASKRKFRTRARGDDDKALVRQTLLNVATTFFGKNSFDAVSMRAVAEAAGYTPGTIYQYFASKTALYICVKEEAFNEVLSRLEKASKKEQDARRRLSIVMTAYVGFWVDNSDHFKSLFSMSGTIEDRRMPDGTLFGESYTAVRAFQLFDTLVSEFFESLGARLPTALNATMTSSLLAACHGAVSLPFGAMTMKLPDSRLMSSVLIDATLTAWEEKVRLARKRAHWPMLRKSDLVPDWTSLPTKKVLRQRLIDDGR